VPTSKPNWVSLRPSSAFISTPMIAKIVQTAKQAVKANVLSQSAPCCCCGETEAVTMNAPYAAC